MPNSSRTAYMREYMRSYSQTPEYRERRKLRDAVYKATKTGQLTRQPCETCGNPKTDGHHTDPTKPLNVQWLCHPCHLRLHHQTDRQPTFPFKRHENNTQPAETDALTLF